MSTLSLHKETLTELTPDQMANVVGGQQVVASCLAASCITNPIAIRTTAFCGG